MLFILTRFDVELYSRRVVPDFPLVAWSHRAHVHKSYVAYSAPADGKLKGLAADPVLNAEEGAVFQRPEV